MPVTLRALLNRRARLVERLRVLTGHPCCRRQQERSLEVLLGDYAKSPLFSKAEKIAL